MCGIVGIAAKGPIDRRALAEAVTSLHHRGPDDSGSHIDAGAHVALGATRLAIIDLSPAGHQPIQSPDARVTLVFNGEIYNFRELRRDLEARGHRFRGHSDTEVLLAGYIEYGTKVLEHLNGIFAFAIYDKARDELFLARDQAGVKPLYYVEANNGFVFGSEIKALLPLACIARELDLSAIQRYITFLWCPGEQTPLKGVLKLTPGTALIVKRGAIARKWTYYSPPRYNPRRDWNAQTCAAELHDLLASCVRRQMVSDAPVGAFLSGGVDSSALVAAARNIDPGIHCFTIQLAGGNEPGISDDLPYARSVAELLGVRLDCVRVDAGQMAEKVADMVTMLDEPLADPACLNSYFISALARSLGIKVLLSGLGGDDLFSGYRRHTYTKLDPLWSRIPGAARRWAAGLDRRGPLGRRLAKALEASSFSTDERIARVFAWIPPETTRVLLAPAIRDSLSDVDPLAPLTEFLAPLSDLPALEKCLALDRRFFLADHNLIYTDKMSMAASVEVRVPYLDNELLAFAAQIPQEWKHSLLTPKWILKKAEESVLPKEILSRAKTGFGAPLRRWLKGDLASLVDELLSGSVTARRGLFDEHAIADLRSADASGRIDGSYTIFSIMCIELWCRSFLDRAVPAVTNLDQAIL